MEPHSDESLTAREQNPAAEEESVEPATPTYRVLAVDDNVKLLELCKDLLTEHGYEVDLCEDSTLVLALLKQEEFDIVLLDIRMPGIEGTDLLPLIRKIRPKLPVIIMSAYCDEENVKYYRTLGAFEAISKPFSHEVLLDTIARAVNRQESIPLVLTSLSLQEGRDQVYRRLILTALRKTNWNQVKAAELLGVSRYGLMRWIKRLNISP
jgi:DNA-binding NtrC family response regulator